MRSVLLLTTILGLLLLFGSSIAANYAIAQPTNHDGVIIDFGSLDAPESLELAVAEALTMHVPADQTLFLVTWHKQSGNWYFASIAALNGNNCEPDATAAHGVDGKCIYPILSWWNPEGYWETGLFPHSSWINLVQRTPDDLIAPAAKTHFMSESNNLTSNSTLNYKFPWVGTWSYTQGWHSPSSNGDGIDIGTSASDKRVLAAASGTVLSLCTVANGQSVNVNVIHDDGTRLDYYHLKLSTLRPEVQPGQRVAQGQVLADLMTGSFSELPCGYASQNASWGHLHWDFPNTPDGATFTADSCSIVMNRNAGSGPGSYWTCGSTSVVPSISNPGRLTSTNAPITNACCGCRVSTSSADLTTGLSSGTSYFTPLSAASRESLTTDAHAAASSLSILQVDSVFGSNLDEPLLYNESSANPALPQKVPGMTEEAEQVSWESSGSLEQSLSQSVSTGQLRIGNGNEMTSVFPTTLRIASVDNVSEVVSMRFSRDGEVWTDWEPYVPWKQWQLQDTPDLQTIYAQVKDAADNVSEIMQATVRVELEMARPSSPNYTLARSVFGMGGGRKTSTSYQVQGTSGQVLATSQMQSTEYQVASGFWAGITTAPCYDFGGEPGVGIYDVIAVSERWNGAYDPTFDLDHDGDIDIVDIMMVAAAWGDIC